MSIHLYSNHKNNAMIFKVFKQMGKDVIINIDQIVTVKVDEVSQKTVIYSTTHFTEVDASLDEVKIVLGIGPKKEVRGF
jgi:hypothetical protein